jgi:THO complex subunit 2
MYDECHMTMMQFIDFLSVRCATASNNSAAEASASYCSVLPSITVLLDTYKMQPGVAFTITRPSFSSFLRKGGLTKTSVNAAKKSSSSSSSSVAIQGQSPVCDEVLSAVRQSLSKEVWQSITPRLYSVFWSLSLYDIYTPSSKYERAKTTLQQAMQRNEKEGRTLPDQNSKQARELRREQRSKQSTVDDMNTEFRVQKDNERAVRRWLQHQKIDFLEECQRIESTPQCFLQHCILPRALCSPEDAYFCAIFASILNDLQTPRWSSLNYYDKLNRCLASVVYCVTEREAANLGIFLQETLRLLERWTNPRIYTNECASKPGFNTSIRQASDKRATHDQYVKIFGKWHSKVSVLFSLFCFSFLLFFFFFLFSLIFLFSDFVLFTLFSSFPVHSYVFLQLGIERVHHSEKLHHCSCLSCRSFPQRQSIHVRH